KLAKKKHNNNIITHSNNKIATVWNIVKSTSKIKPNVPNISTIRVNSNLSSDSQIIAEEFNKYFVSVVKNNRSANDTSNQENPISYLSRARNQPFPPITLNCVSSKEIEDIIKSLKTKNSYGYDGISTKILKVSSPYISSPLTYLCNRMLTTGNFPLRLKFSEIKPIYKKGDKNDTSNYRPISLLTSISKIFEKVIYNRMQQHIKKNNILANEQFGFRHARSTDDAAYYLINNILTALNNKEIVGGVFCDLHKAFDSVNYDILLSKLNHYGIKGRAYDVIRSYLSDRYQRVIVVSDSIKFYSKWEPVTVGVPQGSILGPLLFLLYINDLPNAISDVSYPVLFADDTSLIINNPDTPRFEKDINIVLEKLNKWFSSNLLLLNPTKTYFLQFITKNTRVLDLHILCGNKQITNMEVTKFLGLVIDHKLSWQTHIDQMIPKLNKASYIIRVLKPLLSLECLKTVYFSLVHSIISYGIIFWGSSAHAKIIFQIQKRIIRIITNSRNIDSCRNLFKELHILPLQSQYIFSLLMLVVKNRDCYITNSDVHTRNTRFNHDLHLPVVNLTIFQKGGWYSGIKLYNHLPPELKQLSYDIPGFKVALKKFLITSSFYTVEEYYCWKKD
ncbi:hypothetical protein B7P43_G02324, partial [Cryptotermes secundus]